MTEGVWGMSGSSTILGPSRRIWDGLAKLTILGLMIAFVAGLAMIFAGPGRQLGFWDHNFGFKILEWGGYGGLAAAGTALIGLFSAWGVGQRRLVMIGVIGTILGALIAYWPWALLKAHRVPPPLYDISTDIADPPSYVAGLELRKDARLPADYPVNFGAQQMQAYPDIKPVVMQLPPSQAFERAVRAARDMRGWNVHTVLPTDGRIEAVAKTLWFGFEDDVVIRVTAVEGGSRIDLRSTGRIARRDGGANARRVQEYIKKLNAAG